ncbi:MAG: cell division protein FtsA [Candidatus Desulforudis sp.]|nr:cell division protein FtsA [Desulforudis sp.]
MDNVNREIFTLDIGTRSIIGVVGMMDHKRFRITAQTMVEHDSRAMFDGQIHDIPRVARVVSRVKAELEEKVGHRLGEVAIAAAGRSLRTQRCSAQRQVEENREIEDSLIRGLELSALRQAQDDLDADSDHQESYYCVGHYPVNYFLDDLVVTNLLGHRGRTIGVELIATFLPASVVNGLFAVLRRAELEPVSLTLEPIAAMEVAIPPGMRLLNLALVDIGAGTSDIAITRDGTVVAYGMVPLAGDELTEAIVEGLLVDFDTAEQIKRRLVQPGEIKYTDILGVQQATSPGEVAAVLEPVLDQLAGEVGKVILELNGGQAPKSVVCIGGGVQVPGLTSRIARRLEIAERLVGIRGRDMIQNLDRPTEDDLGGPAGVTVVGIGVLALERAGYSFVNVTVNKEQCRVFNTRTLNVATALGQARFDPLRLIGRNGKDLRFNLNGKDELVLGELSRPAQICVNGARANLQTPVEDGDEIEVVDATNGRDGQALVKNYLLDEWAVRFVVNGREVTAGPVCILNDRVVSPETEIKEGDRLYVQRQQTIGRLAKSQGFDPAACEILVNGSPVDEGYEIGNGDRITLVPLGNGSAVPEPGDGIKVTVNGEPLRLAGDRRHIFIDVLNHLDLNPTELTGPPVMRLNGKRAAYTDVLKDGDDIVISWEAST